MNCSRCNRPVQDVIRNKIADAYTGTDKNHITWTNFFGISLEGNYLHSYAYKTLCPACYEYLWPGKLQKFFKASIDKEYAALVISDYYDSV